MTSKTKKRVSTDGVVGAKRVNRRKLNSRPLAKPATAPSVPRTSEQLAEYLVENSINDLIDAVNATSADCTDQLKGRLGEHLGAAWYLLRSGDESLRAYLLDRGDPASIPKKIEKRFKKDHSWFEKIRPETDVTGRSFDVVIAKGSGDATTIVALLSCKWSSGVDAWHGKLKRKVGEWPEEEKSAFGAVPQYVFQVVPCPTEGQRSNQTARTYFDGKKPEVSLDWQVEVEREDNGKEWLCVCLKHLNGNGNAPLPVPKRTPRGWQIAARDAVMGHVRAAAPLGKAVAGEVVAAPGSGKTDVIEMTLADLFASLSSDQSRIATVFIETLEGAGRLQAALSHLDADVYFLNSSKTGGGGLQGRPRHEDRRQLCR